MSDNDRIAVDDAAAPSETSHLAQDSTKPLKSKPTSNVEGDDTSARESVEESPADQPQAEREGSKAEEYGGQAGPEPTRYGDWEKKGRCTDF